MKQFGILIYTTPSLRWPHVVISNPIVRVLVAFAVHYEFESSTTFGFAFPGSRACPQTTHWNLIGVTAVRDFKFVEG